MKVSNMNPLQQNPSLQIPAQTPVVAEGETSQQVSPPEDSITAPVNAVASLQAESFDPAYTTQETPEVPQFAPNSLDALSQEVFQGLQSEVKESAPPSLTQPDLPAEPANPVAFSFTSEQLEVSEEPPEAQEEAPQLEVPSQKSEQSPATLEALNPQPTTIADLDPDAQEMVQNFQLGM